MGVAPVLAADADPTPDVARALTALAVAARAGDRDALAVLYTSLEPKISRFVRRYRGWAGGSWDADDVSQEAYLALAGLVDQWSGVGPFLPYFFACYRFRLRDAIRKLDGPAQRETWGVATVCLSDQRTEEAFALAEVSADLAALSASDRALLVRRAWDGERVGEIADQTRVHRRTVHRRWGRLRSELREALAA